MYVIAAMIAVMGLAIMPAAAGSSDVEADDAYHIVARAAFTSLPPPLRQFLEAELKGNADDAASALVARGAEGSSAETSDWHYIMLDAAAGEGDPAARRAAARAFPHNYAEARQLFATHEIARGGRLPWMIDRQYRVLIQAFGHGTTERIVAETAQLLRLSTEAALPFNTTSDRDGKSAGNQDWLLAGTKGAKQQHCTVRYRYQQELITRLRPRFDYEVRVWPGRIRGVSDPVEATFHVLGRAHATLPELLRIDRALLEQWDISDADSFAAVADVYYADLAAQSGAIIASQLESGAGLAATLVTSAWIEAGQPALSCSSGEGSGVPATDQPDEAFPFVGSQNSAIFHTVGCSHAKRIKPDNQVRFRTAEEARATGRVPCKACNPGSP